MKALLEETQEHWRVIGPLLTIRGERDYAAAIERLESLLKEIGDDEQHPLYGLLDTLVDRFCISVAMSFALV